MIFKRKFYQVLNFGLICCGLFISICPFLMLCVEVIVNPLPHQSSAAEAINNEINDGIPDGYYPFVESPKMEPPQVKLPPYIKSTKACPGPWGRRSGPPPVKRSLNNLCGDLNKGFVPVNPMLQNIHGTPYPFELIKNKTLQFFSRTLPILKSDETIPRIATVQGDPQYYLHQQPQYLNRKRTSLQRLRRSVENGTASATTNRKIVNFRTLYDAFLNLSQRQSGKFCDNDKGIENQTKHGVRFSRAHWSPQYIKLDASSCELYVGLKKPSRQTLKLGPRGEKKILDGQMFRSLIAQKRQDPSPEYRVTGEQLPSMTDGPPTPCPAKVEYATPVFARNYQGLWRYVVQIPYEGYFTQTVEVTKCLNSKCFYMDGGCLSSPRWVSLLVAEIFYPETFTPINRRPTVNRSPVLNEDLPPQLHDFHKYQYIRKRAVPTAPTVLDQRPPNDTKQVHCDGVDEFGCFQVRLYFDWFLIPGSCKCWRPDYFAKYARWGRKASYEL